MAGADTLERVKQVIRESIKLGDSTPIADEMRLVGGDYDIDSLDVLLIVTNIEKQFGVRIREGTLDKTAFATISTLADYVETLPREVKG